MKEQTANRTPNKQFCFSLALLAILLAILLALVWPSMATGQTFGSGPAPYNALAGTIYPLQNPPTGISQFTADGIGTPGQRTFWYWVVVQGQFGAAAPSGPFVLFNASNIFDASDGAQLNGQAVSWGITYDILRTPENVILPPAGQDCGCAVYIGLSAPIFTDLSEATGSYTIATANTAAAQIMITNAVTGTGTNQLECVNADLTLNTSGPLCGGGGGGGTPSEPLYSVQTEYPDGTFGNGLGDFLDLAPIDGPLTYGGPGLDFETEDAGTSEYAAQYYFFTSESAVTSVGCPACFEVTAEDLATGDQGGGNILLYAYGDGGYNYNNGQDGGSFTAIANTPATTEEVSTGGLGTILLQDNSNASMDGPSQASWTADAEPFDSSLSADTGGVANLALETCQSPNALAIGEFGPESCDIRLNAGYGQGTTVTGYTFVNSLGMVVIANASLPSWTSGTDALYVQQGGYNTTPAPVPSDDNGVRVDWGSQSASVGGNLTGITIDTPIANVDPPTSLSGVEASLRIEDPTANGDEGAFSLLSLGGQSGFLGPMLIAPNVPPAGGSPDLTVTPLGSEPSANFGNSIIVQGLGTGTSPICPNGTGGALTTTGCSGGGGGTTTNAVTFDASGIGAAPGTTFNGSTAKTISYNTVGAAAAPQNSGTFTTCVSPTSAYNGTLMVMQITATCAQTLPSGITVTGFGVSIQNASSQVLTVAPPSGTIIIGASTTANLTIPSGQTVTFLWNGTSYEATLPLVAGTNITITPGPTGNAVASSGGGGSVTGVTATSPVVSSGGTAPVISLATNYPVTTDPQLTYHASGAGGTTTAGSITSGANTFTFTGSTSGWTSGMGIAIAGAGTNLSGAGAELVCPKITLSGSTATLFQSDGVTACNATTTVVAATTYHDDTLALNLCAASSSGCVPSPGVYNVSSEVTLSNSGNSLMAMTPGQVQIVNRGSTNNTIALRYCNPSATPYAASAVRNLWITQSSATTPTAGGCLYATCATTNNQLWNAYVQGNVCLNTYNGIQVGAGVSVSWFQDNEIHNTLNAGFYYDDASPNGDNHFDDNELAGFNTAGIVIKHADTFELSNNKINGSGIQFIPAGDGSAAQRVRFINQNVESASSSTPTCAVDFTTASAGGIQFTGGGLMGGTTEFCATGGNLDNTLFSVSNVNMYGATYLVGSVTMPAQSAYYTFTNTQGAPNGTYSGITTASMIPNQLYFGYAAVAQSPSGVGRQGGIYFNAADSGNLATWNIEPDQNHSVLAVDSGASTGSTNGGHVTSWGIGGITSFTSSSYLGSVIKGSTSTGDWTGQDYITDLYNLTARIAATNTSSSTVALCAGAGYGTITTIAWCIDKLGTFGVGSSTAATSDSFYVTTAGAVTAASVTAGGIAISGTTITPTTSTAALTLSTQSASSSGTIGSVLLAGGFQTGTGGTNSLAGGIDLSGGNNAGTSGSSQAGSTEVEPGESSAGGLQGLMVFGYQATEGVGTTTQWNLQCWTSANQITVNDCGASPTDFVGVTDYHSGSAVEVHVPPSESPINASSAVTLYHTVCAGSTPGKVTDSGGTGPCPAGSGITVGRVIAIGGGARTLADGATFTPSSTLPLIAMTNRQQVGPGDISGVLLPGTTGTITGTALTATCDSGTATVTGATVGSPVSVSSTTGADVGGAFDLRASVTSSGTVTVYVCGTGTPSSLAYNVYVLQ